MPKPDHNENDDLNAPEALVQALRDRARTRVAVPKELDHEILNAAHEHLRSNTSAPSCEERRREETSKIVQLPGIWTRFAAVAAAMVLLGIVWVQIGRRDATRSASTTEPTIVDAFMLARQLNENRALSNEFDLNDDGVVDERDVTLLAQQAVALPDGGAM